MAQITATAQNVNADGSYNITADDNGRPITITIPREMIIYFLQQVQGAMIAGAKAGIGSAELPVLTLTDINLGHGQQESSLLVSTDQMGWIALRGGETVFRRLKTAVDALLPVLEARGRSLS